MSLQSLGSCTPHGDFIVIILYFTVCCSYCLKTPHNGFPIDETELQHKKSIYGVNYVQNVDHSNISNKA